MGKKCLIIYSSYTGNTEKVASRLRGTFERAGWDVDSFSVGKESRDMLPRPFTLSAYDFICVGSGIRGRLPYNEVLNILRGFRLGINPRLALQMGDEPIRNVEDLLPDAPRPEETADRHRKVVFGPDAKKAVVFVTYGGFHLGPKEAEPALQLLELEIEHVGVECIGRFSCPGKYLDHPTPGAYHGDIRNRPDERDLLRAELFIEEKIEEIADRTT